MNQKLTAKQSIIINSPASKVWNALTNPDLIKQYCFGVEAISDWKVGSPIIYKGVWEGKEFEDKGNILRSEPQKLLLCNYWSSFSGLPDSLENYQNVAYELSQENSGTRLTITQDNIPDEKGRQQSEQNWGLVLNKLKELLETEKMSTKS
jgi:uncharacterized protein YndB with AHSA1/START domain